MSLYSDILRIGFHAVCMSGGTISRMIEPPAQPRRIPQAAIDVLKASNAKLLEMNRPKLRLVEASK